MFWLNWKQSKKLDDIHVFWCRVYSWGVLVLVQHALLKHVIMCIFLTTIMKMQKISMESLCSEGFLMMREVALYWRYRAFSCQNSWTFMDNKILDTLLHNPSCLRRGKMNWKQYSFFKPFSILSLFRLSQLIINVVGLGIGVSISWCPLESDIALSTVVGLH